MTFAITSILFIGLGQTVNVLEMESTIIFDVPHSLHSSITCSWLASTQLWAFPGLSTFFFLSSFFWEPIIQHILGVATLLWPSVGVKPNTWKKLGLESFGTPENSEDDLEDQNTWHWGVLGVIGKVLKRRYRKCPRILDLDIWSPSYGQKKGRESNWQFDSRPLKVGNRPAPDVQFGSAIRRWKDLDEGYNFGWDLVAIRGRGEELCPPKVPGVQNRDTWVDFGTSTWESWEFVPFGCGCGGALQSIL
jgi:hypothetical protein